MRLYIYTVEDLVTALHQPKNSSGLATCFHFKDGTLMCRECAEREKHSLAQNLGDLMAFEAYDGDGETLCKCCLKPISL